MESVTLLRTHILFRPRVGDGTAQLTYQSPLDSSAGPSRVAQEDPGTPRAIIRGVEK